MKNRTIHGVDRFIVALQVHLSALPYQEEWLLIVAQGRKLAPDEGPIQPLISTLEKGTAAMILVAEKECTLC